MRTSHWIVVAAGIVGLCGYVIWDAVRLQGTPEQRTNATTTTRVWSGTHKVGDRAVLSYADGESFVWLSVDEATRKALHRAVAADDKIGVLELEHIGKLHRFQSADRTPVLVLERIRYGYKVRILGGDKLGLVGLVPTEGVQPQ